MTATEMSAEDYRKQGAEKVWQKKIVHVAKLYGWSAVHHPYSIGADPGYPDLTCLKPGYPPLWIEVKGPKGKVSQAQVDYLALVNQVPGALGIVVFPDDLEAVADLLAHREVETFEDDRWPVLRVRLITEV